MTELLCLKEIEEPHVFHSPLNLSNRTSRYCVFAENYFIVFRKPSEIVSLFRVPINKSTKLNFKEREFTIAYYDYSFTFSHQTIEVIAKWRDVLTVASTENVKEVITNFYSEVVQIDKIKNCDCPIVLSKTGFRLLIFENYDYQRSDICRHVINLKVYHVTLRGTSKTVSIRGVYEEFKMTFASVKLAIEWHEVLNKSLGNYLKVDTIVDEICQNESNRWCAECGVCDPNWVSVNLCVTLCDNCVGKHRELGTSISRTQSAVMDTKCWSDKLLVKLLTAIGNKTVNQFWLKNVDNCDVTVEKKYKQRLFIDTEFTKLDFDEIVGKLSQSVTTDDVALTMRLWFSIAVNIPRQVVDNLRVKAVESQKTLQDKFLSLQENIAESEPKNDDNSISLYETVCRLSIDSCGKKPNLFLVNVYRDRIVIKTDNPDLFVKENIEICTIFMSYINMAHFSTTKYGLQLSFYPECKFFLSTPDCHHSVGYLNISQLSFFDIPFRSIIDLKIVLFSLLLSDWSDSKADDSALFLYNDIQINKEALVKCKGYVINHELVLENPINRHFDLTQIQEIEHENDTTWLNVTFPHMNLLIEMKSDIETIFSVISDASKIRLLSLTNDHTVTVIEEMINFVKFFGLHSVGVFQCTDNSDRVASCFDENCGNFHLAKYSVAEVTTCLRKTVSSLLEPLIPDDIFQQLETADTNDNPLQHLPASNYRVLRHLIELLFLIIQRSKLNNMDLDSLVKATAADFLSKKETSQSVLKHLIENLFTLFNYSAKEKTALLLFLKNLDNPVRTTINRTFHVDITLINCVKENHFASTEHMKLPTVSDTRCYVALTVRIDELRTVADLVLQLFTDLQPPAVYLWQLIFVKTTLVKRLLYCHDRLDGCIVNRRQLLGKFRSEKNMEYLIFSPIDKRENPTTFGTSYRCNVKLDKAKCEIILSMPNLLTIYGLERDDLLFEFNLSDICVYRTHNVNPGRMYIVTSENDVFVCDFKKQVEFQEFFIHFDIFRFKYGS